MDGDICSSYSSRIIFIIPSSICSASIQHCYGVYGGFKRVKVLPHGKYTERGLFVDCVIEQLLGAMTAVLKSSSNPDCKGLVAFCMQHTRVNAARNFVYAAASVAQYSVPVGCSDKALLDNVSVLARFQKPVSVDVGNVGYIRKLLNLANGNVGLLCDVGCVYGVVSSDHGGVLVFFNLAQGGKQDKYAGDVKKRVRDEVKRLYKVSTGIDPEIDVNASVASAMSAIDGAMLMDVDCKCYAVGAILDGVAGDYYGNKERGSRYNSSERYAENNKSEKCNANKNVPLDASNLMVVVISEDGMVDIFPQCYGSDDDKIISDDDEADVAKSGEASEPVVE